MSPATSGVGAETGAVAAALPADPALKRRPPGATPYEVMFPLATIGSLGVIGASALAFSARWTPPYDLGPYLWHAHEMLFGHFPMAFGGVVLTGLPRWTKRPGVGAATTFGLVGLWAAARAAMAFGLVADRWPLALLAAAFPLALAIVAGRAIFAARDRRDYGVVGLLVMVALADSLFLLDLDAGGDGGLGLRLGLATAATGAMVLGGRIIPALTRHLASERGRPVPPLTPVWLDRAALGLGAVAVYAWAVAAEAPATAIVLAVAAVAHVVRLATWRGLTTLDWPPFLALHLGYAFLPFGLGCAALSVLFADIRYHDAAIHAWGAGVFGLMCVAVMSSVLRRYSGRALTRDRLASALFATLALAAVCRLTAIAAGGSALLFDTALTLWGLGQGLFLVKLIVDRRARRAFAPKPRDSAEGRSADRGDEHDAMMR